MHSDQKQNIDKNTTKHNSSKRGTPKSKVRHHRNGLVI